MPSTLDPVEVQEWLDDQEEAVKAYLETERVSSEDEIELDWCLAPYVALWRAQLLWVISGDLPTDYLKDPAVTNTRAAIQTFSNRWSEVADHMEQGKHHPTIKIGPQGDMQELKKVGEHLRTRANILNDWTQRDELWSGEGQAL